MRYIIGPAAFLFSCGHCMQTRPTCILEQYGIVEFYNFTDTRKLAFAQRIIDEGILAPLIQNIVEPRTMHTYRLYPGVYYLGVQFVDGRREVYKAYVPICVTITVKLERRRVAPEEEVIRPRRIGC